MQELGLGADVIERIVLYGELMCTESNYDSNLRGQFLPFGFMIKAKDDRGELKLQYKLAQKGFFSQIRGGCYEVETFETGAEDCLTES